MYIEHLKPEMHFPIEIMLIHRVYFPKAAYICPFNLKCVWTTIYLKAKKYCGQETHFFKTKQRNHKKHYSLS